MSITLFLLQYYCLSLPESYLLNQQIQSSRFDLLDESPSLIKTIPTDILDDTFTQSKYRPDTIIIPVMRK